MTLSPRGRYSALDIYFAASRDGASVVEAVAYAAPITDAAGQTNLFVAAPPTATAQYRWREGDRMDSLAFKLLGLSTLYWQIMDLNPTIMDATAIAPGTLITVPRV